MSVFLAHTRFKNRNQFVSSTLDVARHYGFLYLPHALSSAQKVTVQSYPVVTLFPHEDALRAIVRQLAEKHAHVRTTHTLGFDVHTISHGSGKTARKETCVSLHVAGSSRPIAEAMVIITTCAALKEAGIPDCTVHINPIGNNDSNQRYNKELSNYLRKVLPNTPSILEDIHERPRRVLARLVKECSPLVEGAPTPLEFLNDDARGHLKQLLEYLEAAGIAYVLDPTVIGSHEVWEYTLFDIRKTGNDERHMEQHGDDNICVQPDILAVGGRYTPYIRKAHKHQVDSVACLISIDDVVTPTKKDLEAPKQKTQFFFGHVSEVAKRTALRVLGMLREAGVFVHHAVTRETLTHQLTHMGTGSSAPTYMVMIGHKEALAGTAIVRNEATRAQREIPIGELAKYLQKLK